MNAGRLSWNLSEKLDWSRALDASNVANALSSASIDILLPSKVYPSTHVLRSATFAPYHNRVLS